MSILGAHMMMILMMKYGKEDKQVMMYSLMTLDDDMEIVHSETLPDGKLKAYIQIPSQ